METNRAGRGRQSVPHPDAQFCTHAGMRSTGLSLFGFDMKFWTGPYCCSGRDRLARSYLPACNSVSGCLPGLLSAVEGRRGGGDDLWKEAQEGGGNRWGGGQPTQPAFGHCSNSLHVHFIKKFYTS